MPSGVDIDTPAIMESLSIKDDSPNCISINVDPEDARGLDENVEVVLGDTGTSKIMEHPVPDQNVFRYPQTVRPRAMRAPMAGPPHQHPSMPHPAQYTHPPPHYPYGHHGSGSWGYGPPPPYPPPPDAYRGHMPPHPQGPYPTTYPPSANSFDEHGAYHLHNSHYSPHIQYPGPRYSGPDEVNVISPNHKGDPHYRPPITPRPRTAAPYYHYPPTSPVSRPGQSGPPRIRNYAIRRGQESRNPEYADDGHWNSYGPPHPTPPVTTSSNRGAKSGLSHPPIVAESFDSVQQSRSSSSQTTPKSGNPPPAPQSSDPHMQFYGGGGSWGSFDSTIGQQPYFDEQQRYYGMPPDSPYSSTPYNGQPPYTSPGALYHADSFSSPHPASYGPPPMPPTFSYSYDDDDHLLHDYQPDHDVGHNYVTPPGASSKKIRSKSATPVSSNISSRNSLLPKAAEEIDFDVVDPPLEPVVPECDEVAICDSLAEVNSYDVLCGRGGGTNSQIGNRRFRQLVQEFQPIYLMAKRKEKPLLARTIVLIIRKRGGRFLKKNEESGELFEVGDLKAEAKTSQALREGLDVRATKSGSNHMSKKGDKAMKSPGSADSVKVGSQEDQDSPAPRSTESPPTIPRLQGGVVHPHSPESNELRKRRRVRSAERFVSDFMPPRADFNNRGEDEDDKDDNADKTLSNEIPSNEHLEDGEDDDVNLTPLRRNGTRDEEDFQDCGTGISGCAGIALDIVTGAAKGSFCFGPTGWSR